MPETTTTSLGVNERARHLETLAATPAALKAALRGVPRKLLLFTPAPGKWSILEILCHLRDMEREGYLERYTRILAENEPRLPDLNGDALAIERAYRGQKAGDVLRDWMRLRRESLRLLKKSKPEQWRRAGFHETAGRLTIDDLVVRHAVGNDTAHLAQIDAIKRRAAVLERLSAAPAALAEALKGAPDEAVRRKQIDIGKTFVDLARDIRHRLLIHRRHRRIGQHLDPHNIRCVRGHGPSAHLADEDVRHIGYCRTNQHATKPTHRRRPRQVQGCPFRGRLSHCHGRRHPAGLPSR